MKKKPIVSVVDDDDATREVICEMIHAIGLSVNSFASAEEFLQQYSDIKPDCLVLDVRMPGMSGMELLEKMNNDDIYLPTVIVTGHGDIPMAIKAVKMGAINFIEKPFREQSLWDSIENALAVGREQLLFLKNQRIYKAKLANLTQKEWEILKHLLLGLVDKQIAYKVGLSRRTAAYYRNRILGKLEVSSFPEMATIIEKYNISI